MSLSAFTKSQYLFIYLLTTLLQKLRQRKRKLLKILGETEVRDLHLDAALMSSEDESGVAHPPQWRSARATELFQKVIIISNIN